MGDEYEPSQRLIGSFHNGTSNRATGQPGQPSQERSLDKSGRAAEFSRARGMAPGAASARDTFGEKALGIEQSHAEDLQDALLPHFVSVFSRAGRALNPKIGSRVVVKVLPKSAFGTALDEKNEALWRETYVWIFKHDYDYFLRRFMRAWRPKISRTATAEYVKSISTPLVGKYSVPPRRFDELNPADAKLLIPDLPSGHPSAFWYAERATINILSGHVNGGTLAHEMCHAYASEHWRTFYRSLTIYDFAEEMTQIYEGVTSQLADYVIHEWKPPLPTAESDAFSGRRTSVRRLDAPSGFGGYDYRYKAMASALIRVMGQEAVVRWYFAGTGVVVALNRMVPTKTLLVCGKARLSLGSLFEDARVMQADFRDSYP